MPNLNFEEYRHPFETGPHWELKREFLEKYQDDYDVDRLLCLAQAYSNIELLQCSYPEPVMQEVRQLSYNLKGCRRFREARENLEKKEKPELQARRGKRSSSDGSSSKPYKFIKFCSPKESESLKGFNKLDVCETNDSTHEFSASNDTKDSLNGSSSVNFHENCKTLPKSGDKNKNIMFSLLHSPDICSIKIISEAIPKKFKSAYAAIESALQISGLEDAVKYTYTTDNYSASCCQFYIKNTLISTGRDGNETTAAMKASEYALEILKKLPNLPHKTLNDLKLEWQKWIVRNETIQFETIATNLQLQFEALTKYLRAFNKESVNEDLFSMLTLIEKLLKIKDKKMAPAHLIQEAAAAKSSCGTSNVFYFNFSEDLNTPLHLRSFHCDLVIKKIFICQGKGCSKKMAKSDAAEKGLICLTKFFDFGSESDKIDTIQNELPSQELSSNNKQTLSINNASVSSLDNNLQSSQTSSKTLKEDKFSFQSLENCNPHRYDQSTKSNCSSFDKSKDISSHRTECEVESHEKLNSRFTVNDKLLRNSIKRQLVLFDTRDIRIQSSLQSPAAILNYSLNRCQKTMACDIDETPEKKAYRCDICIDGEHFGEGSGFCKQEAKQNAMQNTLENLQNTVYTIKVKNEVSDSFVVSRNNILNAKDPASVLNDSNVGHKMMKMMGWTGGSIGRSGGITEPITASDHYYHQGLGFSNSMATTGNFKEKIHALLKDYSLSNTTSDLIFATDFSKEERKEVHRLASKYNLNSNSRGKNEKRQLFISRKITTMDLLKQLIEVGGSTEKYELLDRSTK